MVELQLGCEGLSTILWDYPDRKKTAKIDAAAIASAVFASAVFALAQLALVNCARLHLRHLCCLYPATDMICFASIKRRPSESQQGNSCRANRRLGRNRV